MGDRLAGKTSLITGAASGFGRAMALKFAAEGSNIVMVDLNADGMKATKGLIHEANSDCTVVCQTTDVSDHDAVQDGLQQLLDQGLDIHILVNNAGWSHPNRPILEVDANTFRRVYEINVFSIYNYTQAIVPHWRKLGGGVMLNISSTAGLRPRPGLTWYNSTKGAVNIMTKSLGVELAPNNIRVCGIAPVIGNTALTETFMGVPDTPENRKKFLSSIPLGRYCEPEDVAEAALYLVSDEANFITGVILEVDGGRCI